MKFTTTLARMNNSNNTSIITTTTLKSKVNYKYIFIFLISIVLIILYYIIIYNILVYINVINITFNDNITITNTDYDTEVNIFDNIYPILDKISQSTNVSQDISNNIFSIFLDLFKTNSSIKYFPSYFMSNTRYENDTYTILELIYSQHYITLNNQELIYINNIESIYNAMYNNIKEYSSIVN